MGSESGKTLTAGLIRIADHWNMSNAKFGIVLGVSAIIGEGVSPHHEGSGLNYANHALSKWHMLSLEKPDQRTHPVWTAGAQHF